MRRDLRSSAVNGPVAAFRYIPGGVIPRVMMTKRILTICTAVSAALAAGLAGTSIVSAQGYPPPPGSVYAPTPQPYPPGYPADYRAAPRPMDFDVLEDDEGPNGPGSTRISPPGAVPHGRPLYNTERGPVMSPDDPRYGRPPGAPPTYSGPVMSPDDPRYGRPMPPP